MIRGRFGLGTTRPVFGFLQSDESARDHSPFLPAFDLIASRDKSNGKLKPTTSSPFRMDFHRMRPTNEERFSNPSVIFAGNNSIEGNVEGLSLYRCRSFI